MAFRVGVIGLGMAVAPHARSLLDLKDRVGVAWAYSPSEARRAKFAQGFAFPLADRLETILEDRSVAAVLILTPPNTHLELVERCAAAGKHILLEKPLEITLQRSERLVSLCSGITLGVVLQHRFRPAAERLHQLLPRLGRLVSASASVPNWRPQSYYDEPGRGTRARDGGGVLLTQAIHTLDLLTWYAGEAAEVKSFSTTTPVHRMETEDLACAAIRFASGALGVVHATTTAYPGHAERIELIGTEGSAVLEGMTLRAQFRDGSSEEVKGALDSKGAGGTGADPMAFKHDAHRGVLADFVDAVEQRRPPRSSGASALAVHRLIERLSR
jgi:UDP-N-acetyl-2-amino-2-deoxyglucuronate dehydrogenase